MGTSLKYLSLKSGSLSRSYLRFLSKARTTVPTAAMGGQGARAPDEDARAGAPCVCLVGPLLLLGEDGVQAPRGALREAGEPRLREGDAHLGVLVRTHTGSGEDDVAAREAHAAVKGAVSPGADILPRGHGLPRRNGKVQRAGDVLGLDVPAVGDELPIELSGVLPARRYARGVIGNGEPCLLVAVGGIDLEALDGPAIRDAVGAVLVGIRELKGKKRPRGALAAEVTLTSTSWPLFGL